MNEKTRPKESKGNKHFESKIKGKTRYDKEQIMDGNPMHKTGVKQQYRGGRQAHMDLKYKRTEGILAMVTRGHEREKLKASISTCSGSLPHLLLREIRDLPLGL